MADEDPDSLWQLAKVTLGNRNMADPLHDDFVHFRHKLLLLNIRVHASARHDDSSLTTNIAIGLYVILKSYIYNQS